MGEVVQLRPHPASLNAWRDKTGRAAASVGLGASTEEVTPSPSEAPGAASLLREFVAANVDLMFSVPDEDRDEFCQKLRRWGDAYARLVIPNLGGAA